MSVQDVSSSHTGTGYEHNAHISSMLPHTTRPSVSVGVAPVRGSRSDRAEGAVRTGLLDRSLCLRDFLKLGKLRNAACAVATGALSG